MAPSSRHRPSVPAICLAMPEQWSDQRHEAITPAIRPARAPWVCRSLPGLRYLIAMAVIAIAAADQPCPERRYVIHRLFDATAIAIGEPTAGSHADRLAAVRPGISRREGQSPMPDTALPIPLNGSGHEYRSAGWGVALPSCSLAPARCPRRPLRVQSSGRWEAGPIIMKLDRDFLTEDQIHPPR